MSNYHMKLSVALATFNEERNLKDCLESIKDWADEIVIVDGGSTDKTIEIAKKFNAKIAVTDNPPIFHINKQKAIDVSSGDWILQLDADERITPELREEINHIINNPANRDGYWIPRQNFFLGKWMRKGGLYPDPVIRLFRRGKGRLPCKSVHEQIEIDGQVGFLKNHMIHLAFPSFDDYLKKFETYSNLRKEEIRKEIKKPSIWSTKKFLFLRPLQIFFSLFLLRKGFEDGTRGFIYAIASAYQEMMAYGKFWTEENYRKKAKGNEYGIKK